MGFIKSPYKWGSSNRYAFFPASFHPVTHNGSKIFHYEVKSLWFSKASGTRGSLVLGSTRLKLDVSTWVRGVRVEEHLPNPLTATYNDLLAHGTPLLVDTNAHLLISRHSLWSANAEDNIAAIKELLSLYEPLEEFGMLPLAWDGWYALK